MMRDIDLLDKLSPEEETVMEYFRQHPGNTWLQAATDLKLEEAHTCEICWKLRLLGWLSHHSNPDGPSGFTVRI